MRKMIGEIRDSKKLKTRRGCRKTTGPCQAGVVRMQHQQIASIDAWIAMQEIDMSRPEAIRRLVELGPMAIGSR